MSSLEDLKRQIDIYELAARLGLQRPDPKGNYRSPHHPDKNPSLQIGGRKYPDGWYDHSASQGGDKIDLVKWVLGLETGDAIRWLREQYGIPAPQTTREPDRTKSRAEYIADQCRRNPAPALDYLTGRGISEAVAQRAIQLGVVGFNDWTSPSKPAGTFGHGGPATAFMVRSLNPGHLVAVDLRYHDPALNGGVKTQSHGEKSGYPWMLDRNALQRAERVVIVESAINALSAETAFAHGSGLPKWAVLATRGTGAIAANNWSFLRGKKVVICMDHDDPNEKGHCPGDTAAWALYEHLVADKIHCDLVDQDEWVVNDLNDLLVKENPAAVGRALQRFSPWAIPGVPGRYQKGRVRVFLPSAEHHVYFRYRVREAFTSWADLKEDEEGREQIQLRDVAGFRIVAISQVRIASALATTTGEQDHQPATLYAVTVDTPYHHEHLHRQVTDYTQISSTKFWGTMGPIFRPTEFMRLTTLWGHASGLGKRDAVNFVGVCYRGGRLIVNEGPDCYFTQPELQCPYHNFRFPSGTVRDAATVIRAYAKTFHHHAATLILTWTLGAHLKVLLSFWPHLTVQARKGAGKTTLLERLARSTGFQMLSGQSLQTEFRIVTSVGFTSHPVGWEELSSRRQEIIDKAVALLQETYKFMVTRRGQSLTEYLLCAPVLLAGEDVPVRSLIGKLVRAQLQQQGPLLPPDLPPFPVRQWLDYLITLDPKRVLGLHEAAITQCQQQCRAPQSDAGARRMVGNYAALAVAWKLLLDFAGLQEAEFGFIPCLVREMNSHIAETSAEREPWVWILDLVLNEIAANAYPYPYRLDLVNGEEALMIRTAHVMHHLSTNAGLRPIYDGLPVKSDRVFKRQLKDAGVVLSERVNPVINRHQVHHLIALSVAKLEEYGLFPQLPAATERFS